MEWTNATALKFIETYGKYPCLWDPTNPERSSRFRRAEAWHMVRKELGDVYTVEELRRKKESLMTMYRLTKSKVMRSDPEAGYEPTWFAYSAMDAFLGWVYDTCPTPSMKMENNGYVSANSDCYYREESAETNYCDPAKDVKDEPNSDPNGAEDEHNLTEEGSSQSTMNWSNEYTIKFLKLYRRNSCLWDPSNPDNALVQCRTKAWNAIKKELKTPCTIKELKKKKEILIGTYRRFKRKEMKYNSSFYAPDWFAYSLIDSFLAPVYKSSKAFVLRNEKKDRNATYSSSEEEDVKRKQNFVDVSPLIELQTEQANRDISNNNTENDSEDDQELTAQSIETQIDWSSENVLKFLKIFQKHPCLWDPANPRRKNIRHRNRAWLAIKKELGDQYTTEELKKKKEILMCAYRRCRRNIIKSKSTGGVYRPSWFAFPVMDSFLRSTTKCHEASVSAENVESSTELSSEEDTDINNSVNDTQNDPEFKNDWTQEDIIKFIELFQSFPCLWDPEDPDYARRRRRNQAWSKIKKELGDRFTINGLRRRKDMLLCTYRRCKKTAVEVESKNCVYEPTWFAFSLMDSFLASIDKCPVTFVRTDTQNVTVFKTEDTDHNASNSCYNDEDVKRNQKMYSSLPMTSEDPLELVTVVANSDQSNHEDDAQNNSEDEQAASGPESQMDWTNEIALKFLELYKKNPCLWDPTNQERTNKDYVAKTWLAVKSEMGDRCTVEELKKKKDSLLAMYRRCRKRMKETESEPTWFAFPLIDSFLGSIYKCPDPQNSAKTEDFKQHRRADSSYNRVETDDSNAKSESREGKQNDYIVIASELWKENPIDLQVEQENAVENNFEGDERNDPEQEAIADCSQTTNSFCTNEEVLKFIQLYKGHPVLWDPTNIQRRSKPRVADAWNAIKRDLGDRYTVDDLKRKKESLMTTYRTIKKRVMDSAASNDSEPIWFAFAVMDEFLAPIYKNSTLSNTTYADHQSFADSSYYPDESNESNAYSEPETKGDNYVSIVSTSAIKRRNPLKLPGMAKKIKREEHISEEDECSLFGKLVTTKLRKVPEDRRDWLMLKINELFYNDTKGNRD